MSVPHRYQQIAAKAQNAKGVGIEWLDQHETNPMRLAGELVDGRTRLAQRYRYLCRAYITDLASPPSATWRQPSFL